MEDTFLDTTILLELFTVPKQFTVNEKQDVYIDYSCICYIDDEGNIGHKQEIFCFLGFDAFKIDNSKALDVVALLREKAAEKFQIIINAQIVFN